MNRIVFFLLLGLLLGCDDDAEDQAAPASFDTPHADIATGTQGTLFEVPAGDARVHLKSN